MDQFGNPDTTEEVLQMATDAREMPFLSPIEAIGAYGSYVSGSYLRNFSKSTTRTQKELEYRTNYVHLYRATKWVRSLQK